MIFELRDQGKHTEARRAERRDILSDVGTLRRAGHVLTTHGRWIIVTGRHANVSGYAEAWNIHWSWRVSCSESHV